MLTTSWSLWLGVIFVLLGATNVWLILQSSTRGKNAKTRSWLIAAHRVGGYLFLALFLVMAYFMIARFGEIGSGTSSGVVIHLVLALVLGPLIFVKVLIARYYKSYYNFLMPIGLAIFVLSFVLVGIAAGPYLGRQVQMQTVSLEAIHQPPAVIDMNLAAETMQKRCSKCHNLDRVVGARKDTQGWLTTVSRMQALPDSGISDQDARMIISYLSFQSKPMVPAAIAHLEVARALVDQRCGNCHSLDRVYREVKAPGEWSAIVARMSGYAAGSKNEFQPGEDEQILAYLSATQTPDAIAQRKAQATSTSAVSLSSASQQASSITPLHQVGGHNGTTIGFVSLVTVGMLALIFRRPGKTTLATAKAGLAEMSSQEEQGTYREAVLSPNEPLILRLASITRQTPDAKTLRFVMPRERKFSARPGQFLTFSFLFDGRKITRSYSICSSTARSGYIEITPKRVSTGCVSVFLNDRATVGMTVEASGAFGQFYFDENQHRSVVLMAAGSGITPMISMLRYMDDLYLETTVTLLYCARTREDIIFHRDLEELTRRLKNFKYHVLLSRPDAEWRGEQGHISRAFVEDKVTQHEAPYFFLCGPPAFMDSSRAILAELKIPPERIKQESFGNAAPLAIQTSAAEVRSGVEVEFVRSGKTCKIRDGQTLLEAAEEHGVNIPFSCRQGQCGTCKTKLLSGAVRMDAQEGLDATARGQGFILACVGHAGGVVKLDA